MIRKTYDEIVPQIELEAAVNVMSRLDDKALSKLNLDESTAKRIINALNTFKEDLNPDEDMCELMHIQELTINNSQSNQQNSQMQNSLQSQQDQNNQTQQLSSEEVRVMKHGQNIDSAINRIMTKPNAPKLLSKLFAGLIATFGVLLAAGAGVGFAFNFATIMAKLKSIGGYFKTAWDFINYGSKLGVAGASYLKTANSQINRAGNKFADMIMQHQQSSPQEKIEALNALLQSVDKGIAEAKKYKNDTKVKELTESKQKIQDAINSLNKNNTQPQQAQQNQQVQQQSQNNNTPNQ